MNRPPFADYRNYRRPREKVHGVNAICRPGLERMRWMPELCRAPALPGSWLEIGFSLAPKRLHPFDLADDA
jgi:hypothetical protein